MQHKLSEQDRTVIKQLENIEAEMKRIGYWTETPPDFTATSYLDAPSFELWLQCVFLPNANEAARTSQYPQNSQVGLMAMRQYNYHSNDDEAFTLLELLHEFDFIIKNLKNE